MNRTRLARPVRSSCRAWCLSSRSSRRSSVKDSLEPVDLERRARVGGEQLDERYVVAREALQLVDGVGDEHPALEAGGLNDRGGDRLLDALRAQPLLHLGARRLGQVHASAEACDRIPHGIARGIDRAWTSDGRPGSSLARRAVVACSCESSTSSALRAPNMAWV